ncbi:MAG: efflux RND transporter periplasmic adaptor subunit [Verrucomicrobia bacterium]|nr:efflux RND transporter periplasmic adaptor subunit [Verrucomicrobiota bacterium]
MTIFPKHSAVVALFSLMALGLSAANVQTVKPELRDLVRETTQPATVQAFYSADIGVKVTGYVESVPVDIGDRVKKGQVLAIIAAPEMDEQRNALKAEEREFETGVQAAEANLTAVESETSRIQDLVRKGSVTNKAGDEARNRLVAAQAEVAAAKARLGTATARLAEIDALIAYATIIAPFDGILTFRAVDPGDLVHAAGGSKGSDTLLRVAQVNKLRVVTHVPERDAVWLDVGDAVELEFDAFPGKVFTGKIARKAGALNGSTQRMRAEVDLDNSDGQLLPGLYGRAKISLEKRPGALVLPAGAVRFGQGPSHVYVVSGSTVKHQQVTIGLDHGDWVEILSGLSGNEQVVNGMIGRLKDGATVSVK